MPMFRKSLMVLMLLIALGSGLVLIFGEASTTANLDENKQADLTVENTVNDNGDNKAGEKGPKEIAVYISGEVARPGVVLLGSNSRLSDAVLACGDLTPEADSSKVNLASPLKDGQQINIPAKVATSNKANNSDTSTSDLINLNTATVEQLKTLPGIGLGTAQKIIDYRQEHGNFSSIEDLQKVKGIGKGRFAKLKDKITV